MRLRSGLLIGIFGLIVVLLGGWFFTLATALLTYLALLEFFRMAEFKGIKPATKTTLFSSLVIIISAYLETIGLIEGEISNSTYLYQFFRQESVEVSQEDKGK